MSNAPTTALTPGHAGKLAVLPDALDGVALSDAERASLTWLAEFETSTVENIAAVITRAPADPGGGLSSCDSARTAPLGLIPWPGRALSVADR